MHTYETITEHESLKPGQRIRLVYDEYHETRGSYYYETEEETTAAEDYEIERLNSGEWIVLGRIVEELCTGACGGWVQVESLWGIVVENSSKGALEACSDI